MKNRPVSLLVVLAVVLLFAACDGGSPAATPTSPPLPTPTEAVEEPPAPMGTVVDAAPVTPPATAMIVEASPTPVVSTGTGAEVTVLEALAVLKPQALAWQPDARLALLANVRPGQEKALLGGALGNPDINEPTPGGKGRNWSLVALSPSSGGAMAFSMDGTQQDLAQAGAVPAEITSRFAASETLESSLTSINVGRMADSDEVIQAVGSRGEAPDVGIALLTPDGLGLGPLPVPPSGNFPPTLAYELFTVGGSSQTFMFIDAFTREVVLDSANP